MSAFVHLIRLATISLASVCVLLAGAGSADAEVISNYRSNFRGSGWSYLWNAPSDWNQSNTPRSTNLSDGAIGSVADYEPLDFSLGYFTGNGVNQSDAPARFLRMDSVNVQSGASAGAFYDVDPGAGVNNQENAHDRYAIAAFTVSQAGSYSITDSFLTINSDKSDGIEVLIHVDNNPAVYSQILPGGTANGPTTSDFNTSIGNLTAGQTIYIGFGPGVGAANDFAQVNFDISLVPEPSSLAMTGLGLVLLAMRKRETGGAADRSAA